MSLSCTGTARDQEVPVLIYPAALLQQLDGMRIEHTVRFVDRIIQVCIGILECGFPEKFVELCCLALFPLIVYELCDPCMEVFQIRIRIQELSFQFFRHVGKFELKQPVQKKILFRGKSVIVVMAVHMAANLPLALERLFPDAVFSFEIGRNAYAVGLSRVITDLEEAALPVLLVCFLVRLVKCRKKDSDPEPWWEDVPKMPVQFSLALFIPLCMATIMIFLMLLQEMLQVIQQLAV